MPKLVIDLGDDARNEALKQRIAEETTSDTIRARLHEAADTLRALGGDDCYDLADACEYAAHHIPN